MAIKIMSTGRTARHVTVAIVGVALPLFLGIAGVICIFHLLPKINNELNPMAILFAALTFLNCSVVEYFFQ
jgi:hypothetical protein